MKFHVESRRRGISYICAIESRKANWIVHILHKNCFLKYVIEGKIEGRTQVTGKGGRRRKQLLDDCEEKQ